MRSVAEPLIVRSAAVAGPKAVDLLDSIQNGDAVRCGRRFRLFKKSISKQLQRVQFSIAVFGERVAGGSVAGAQFKYEWRLASKSSRN